MMSDKDGTERQDPQSILGASATLQNVSNEINLTDLQDRLESGDGTYTEALIKEFERASVDLDEAIKLHSKRRRHHSRRDDVAASLLTIQADLLTLAVRKLAPFIHPQVDSLRDVIENFDFRELNNSSLKDVFEEGDGCRAYRIELSDGGRVLERTCRPLSSGITYLISIANTFPLFADYERRRNRSQVIPSAFNSLSFSLKGDGEQELIRHRMVFEDMRAPLGE
jgi:hypothetical protein